MIRGRSSEADGVAENSPEHALMTQALGRPMVPEYRPSRRNICVTLACTALLASVPTSLQAQPLDVSDTSAESSGTRAALTSPPPDRVDVDLDARDEAIQRRLRRILAAAGWFENVSVRSRGRHRLPCWPNARGAVPGLGGGPRATYRGCRCRSQSHRARTASADGSDAGTEWLRAALGESSPGRPATPRRLRMRHRGVRCRPGAHVCSSP